MSERKIKVKGLSFSTTQFMVKQEFEDCGDVRDVDKVKDENQECVFYVTFEEAEDAALAVKRMNGKEINGEKITVTFEGSSKNSRYNRDYEDDDENERRDDRKFNKRDDRREYDRSGSRDGRRSDDRRNYRNNSRGERRDERYSSDRRSDRKKSPKYDDDRDYSPKPRELSENVKEMYNSLVTLLQEYISHCLN